MSTDSEDRGPAGDEYEDVEYADDAPRSVFATTWFRAILVVVVLAVVGILALPYLLDWVGPSKLSPTVKEPPLSVPSPPRSAATQPFTAPLAPGAPATPPSAPVASPPTGPQMAQIPPPASGTAEPKAESSPPAGGAVRATTAPAEMKPFEATRKPEGAKASVTDSSRVRAQRLTSAETRPKPVKPTERTKTQSAEGARVAKAAPAKRPAQKDVASHAGGPFWVQLGAFRDEARAKALVSKLRAENFAAEEIAPTGGSAAATVPEPAGAGATDKYDVFVSGGTPEDVNAKLSAKGLSADPVAGGAVIKPSLSLRDAVTLSKDLATEGLKVQVRRASSGAGAERPPAARSASAGGDGLYRVRVGGFPDHAAAEEARKALAAKGHNGFITRGGG